MYCILYSEKAEILWTTTDTTNINVNQFKTKNLLNAKKKENINSESKNSFYYSIFISPI